MELKLDGRVAIVTGASTGIGRGIAKILALEGAQTVTVARRLDLLASLADEIAKEGGISPLSVADDLRDRDAPRRIVLRALERFQRVDILINNAGSSRPLPIDATDEEWDDAFVVNFTAVRKMTQQVLPHMRQQRWGRVVNITGTFEPRGVNGANAAKAGVHMWAKGLAMEVAKDAITVNCLMPGRIHSEQIDQRMYPTARDREQFAEANIPIGHFGDPADVGYAVAFLCSPKAGYITGQRMYIDGGMHRAI